MHVNPLTAFWYVPMNTNLPPFNNLKARQAVNYAIDRNAAVKIFGGPEARLAVLPGAAARASPATSRLLPVHEEPRREVVGAGRRQGQAARQGVGHGRSEGRPSYTPDDEVNKAMGVYLQSVLNQIGYKARVKPISGNIFFTYVQNTKNKVQINVQQWYQDYPAASDFLYILFGCESLPPRERLEHQHRRLLRQEDQRADAQGARRSASTNEQAANALWAKIDRMVTDAGADGDALQPEAHRLRLEARRQLHLQQAVLLARRPVMGPVGAVARAGLVPGPRSLALPMSDALAGGAHRPAAALEPAGASPWALARRRLRRNQVAHGDARRARRDRRSLSLAAPLYADHIATRTRSARTSTARRSCTARPCPVMQQESGGLGLGVTPIGPTWDPQHYFLGADNQGRDVAARLLYGGATRC